MAPLFKKILSVMAMTASAFVLTACGGGGDAEPVNTPPTATAGSVNGAGVEPSKTFSLASQIDDAETPNNLTIVVVQAPTKGTLSINGTSVTYSMTADEIGNDFFTFKVRDTSGAESNTVRQDLIDFNNIGPNTPPTATAGSVNAGVEPSKTFSLTTQIGDAETPNNLTIVVVQAPTKGTLSINGASVTYSMNAGQAGDDFFTFKVRDPSGAESPTVRQDLINFDNA